jgi:hypothetical protein
MDSLERDQPKEKSTETEIPREKEIPGADPLAMD